DVDKQEPDVEQSPDLRTEDLAISDQLVVAEQLVTVIAPGEPNPMDHREIAAELRVIVGHVLPRQLERQQSRRLRLALDRIECGIRRPRDGCGRRELPIVALDAPEL